jgi:membrane-bound serine protease (ClpP class)
VRLAVTTTNHRHSPVVYSEGTLRSRFAVILAWAALAAQALAGARRVIAVDVEGMVHPVTVEIVSRAMEQARRERADALLIRLNTPGGLMDAMRQTIEKMVASPVPVIAYVAPSGGRAASAGVFLLEAADVAAMAPATNTGAAHPVAFGGNQMDPVMKQKVENDAAAYLRSIASKRGRNSALAEKAVLESKSFTEKEALDNRLIDLVARDERDLLAQLEGHEVVRFDGSRQVLHLRDAAVVTYEKTWRERLVSAISDPNIALVLLVVGALAIYVEFSAPGMVAPGAIGAILVLLGLSAISILPINWMGASLLLLSFALFILEAKLGAHGVLAAGGAVAMALGAVMLIDSPIPELRIHWSTAIGLALPFSAITAALVVLVVRARRNKVETGTEGMIGEIGTVIADLAPEGKVFVHGEYWNAVCKIHVPAGARVRVTGIDRLKLAVEPLSTGE